MRPTPLLEFRHVTRRWRAGVLGTTTDVLALSQVSLRLHAGQLMAVTGAGGAGKSTLLMLAAGVARPTGGTVRWQGELDHRPLRPQIVRARPWEYHFLTVRQALAFHADVLALGEDPIPAPTRFLPLMHRVGLVGMSRVRLGSLGALDQLRVVVAQALLARPQLICCDEPFAFLGPADRAVGIALLQSIAAGGVAVIIAGRDGEACGGQGTADKVLRLVQGRADGLARPRRNVLELLVPSPDDAMWRLLPRLPSVARRGRRLRVPLVPGTSPESVLALCRDAGVAVRASRVAEEALPRDALREAAPLPPPDTSR
ncbi:MAG: ATP-binding cassette domain-containing protein [Gemmatimonadaceae bacterium]|nr:ATP-binding cassette domain-containing protein [Gemmatimonadaceae bacterium]MCW5826022.1 ATP-binding cassette domain-containing protein [Gemmatimonadaceae bacterium]